MTAVVACTSALAAACWCRSFPMGALACRLHRDHRMIPSAAWGTWRAGGGYPWTLCADEWPLASWRWFAWAHAASASAHLRRNATWESARECG